MKFKKYPHLTGLLLLIATSAFLFTFHIITGTATVALLVLGQLAAFAVSKPRAGVFYLSGLTDEQTREFEEILKGLKSKASGWDLTTDKIASVERLYDQLSGEFKKFKKNSAFQPQTGVRWLGGVPFVTDDCASAICASFVVGLSQLQDGLEAYIPDSSARQRILGHACGILGVTQRAGGALSPTDIPLPTIYAPQIVELVFAYGQARQYATVFPLGAGTVKLPRLKAGEDDFGYVGAGTAGQSQNIPQKEVEAELVTFTANKAGGLIRIPYEIEEDTFVSIGQFLARYVARQLAKLEDKTLFLADGTGAYANQTGIATYCSENPAYLYQLAAGKTKPGDPSVDDFRNMRGQVSAAILGNMVANGGGTAAAYYLHPTFEPLLRSFNKYPNFVVFEYVNGKPMLDGWPVRWIGVSQPFSSTTAAPSAPIAFFGDLSYWYLGERGAVRVEVSKEVFFATDEIAMRALERIDVECLGIDAMVTLMTAAE